MYDLQRAGSPHFNEDPMTDPINSQGPGLGGQGLTPADYGRRIQAPVSINSFSDEDIAKEHERRVARRMAIAKAAFDAYQEKANTEGNLISFDPRRDGPAWLHIIDAVLAAAAKRPW
jgi:hypothetical protein